MEDTIMLVHRQIWQRIRPIVQHRSVADMQTSRATEPGATRRGSELHHSLEPLPDILLTRYLLRAARGIEGTPVLAALGEGATLDWERGSELVVEAGLARAILPVLQSLPDKTRPPAPTIERLIEAGWREGRREAIQRQMMEHISSALDSLQTVGVALYGAAALVYPPWTNSAGIARATSRIDLLVAEQYSVGLHRLLLSLGFVHEQTERRSALYPVPLLAFQGVMLQIHSRIMPRLWQLPEVEMRSTLQRSPTLPHLYSLSPESALLHAMLDCTAHFFTNGLKSAFDLTTILEMSVLDIRGLLRMVSGLKLGRAFWTPFGVLSRELNITLPHELTSAVMVDERQEQLEFLASHRFFGSVGGPEEVSRLTRDWVILLLCEDWIEGAKVLASLLEVGFRDLRTGVQQEHSRDELPHITSRLKEAVLQWWEIQIEWRRVRLKG